MKNRTCQFDDGGGTAIGNKVSEKLHNSGHGPIDPASEVFGKAFPHLRPGMLRQRLSCEEIQHRAFSEMSNIAGCALRVLGSYDKMLVERMVDKFVERVFDSDLMNKFDSEQGQLDGFLYGVMGKIALECFRERSRQRIETRCDQSILRSREPAPSVIPERDDEIERVRKWVVQLPPAQRNAVARRFAALADLDCGGTIPNERVTLHRGLKRLRQKATESDLDDSTQV
jgi:DNA-directed RNA polymerase specialized sigma24 family protein